MVKEGMKVVRITNLNTITLASPTAQPDQAQPSKFQFKKDIIKRGV